MKFLASTPFIFTLQLLVTFASDMPDYITFEEFQAVANISLHPETDFSQFPLPPRDYNMSHIAPLARAGVGPRLWPNARVPYVLDRSFTAAQRREVALAIKEFHDNTCIRFVPKQPRHQNWVRIRQDPKACGWAHVCMNYGEQEVAVGGKCVVAAVLIHELGHTLCLSHEQSRRDRDEWIGFDETKCQPHLKDGPEFSLGLHKLYDYVSTQHYQGECYIGCFKPKQPGVTKCGSGGPLSVLDIELLNEVYGCNSGCHSYRYVNARRNPNYIVGSFGSEPDGRPRHSCTAYHDGDIIPGKYDPDQKACFVPYGGREHKKTGKWIEVLTNPHNAKLVWIEVQGGDGTFVPENALKGGRTKDREPLYVVKCEIKAGGKTIWHPGKYHRSTGNAYTSWGGREIKCEKRYLFLGCDD